MGGDGRGLENRWPPGGGVWVRSPPCPLKTLSACCIVKVKTIVTRPSRSLIVAGLYLPASPNKISKIPVDSHRGEKVAVETATLDHRIPVSAGGSNDPENLATACLMCNSIKSGRSIEDAAMDIL